MSFRSARMALGLLLLAAFIGYAGWRVLRPHAEQVLHPGSIEIRFAHWQLEPGVREAFDAIAADYMKLHPEVRIRQMPIPGQVWKEWLRTQLVGGQPPDLIELAFYNVSSEMLARYFVPLTDALQQPNPYDADDPDLRGLSWRQTYSSQLAPGENVNYYDSNLMEYYGVPNAIVTVRVFYNRDIMRAALGEDRTPKTFREFLDICADLQNYAQRTGQPITPLAGSVFNVRMMTDQLFGNVTQKLALELDYDHDLELTKFEGMVGYLRGRWSLETPAVRTSLDTVSAFGRYLPPGWAQAERQDTMMQFLQGRTAMLCTGTWDIGGILQQAKFPIGAFKVPAITPESRRFGKWALGAVSEANTFDAMPFGVTRASRHQAQAIDFLRFMSSRRGNTIFSRVSDWLPVIKGVPVPKVAETFKPVETGYITGLNLRAYGTSSVDIFSQNLYLLSGPRASAQTYIDATRPMYRQMMPGEMAHMARLNQDTIRQKDSVLPGWFFAENPEGLAHNKFDLMAASQLEVEARQLQAKRTLGDYPDK